MVNSKTRSSRMRNFQMRSYRGNDDYGGSISDGGVRSRRDNEDENDN
jgi:hypothetical protein